MALERASSRAGRNYVTGGSKNKEVRAKAGHLAGFPFLQAEGGLVAGNGLLRLILHRKLPKDRLCASFHIDVLDAGIGSP